MLFILKDIFCYIVVVLRQWRRRFIRWVSVICYCDEKSNNLYLANYFGMAYVLGLVLSTLSVNAFYTCPELYGWPQCRKPIMASVFIVVNLLTNWFLFLRTVKYNRPSLFALTMPGESTVVNMEENIAFSGPAAKSMPDDGYTKYCRTCEQRVPKRCHHCPICNYCVLKKDHHCFITGACVGFGNQRYFIVFLFYAFLCASYGMVWTFRLLNHHFPVLWPYGWMNYFAPVALVKYLMVGDIPFVVVLGACLLSAIWAGICGSSGFLATQMYCVITGTTLWENVHRLDIQDGLSIRQRFHSVFGPYWMLNFIFPVPCRNKLMPGIASFMHASYSKDL